MKISYFTAISVVLVFITGCATGAKVENIAIQKNPAESYDQQLREQLSIDNVTGGKNTNPLWTSEISNEVFTLALSQTLEDRGLLSSDGNFTLTANLLKVEQPLFGLATTVTTHIQYRIRNQLTEEVVFEKTIVAPGTVNVSEEFIGVRRLRLANEKSAKENIKMFLDELAKIDMSNISLT